jgi:adenosylcobinamide-GDP ribazoletransferase
MRGLLDAFQFMTILPLGKPREFEPHRMVAYFPLVGLAIGGLLALLDPVFVRLWGPAVAGLLDVFVLIAVTGAFHLDGLGDTADGLYGRRNPEAALAIMKDSRIGVMGLLAIVCCLAAKWAGLAGLQQHRPLLLMVIPAFSRSAILFGLRFLPYARSDGGTGRPFFDQKPAPASFAGVSIPLGLSFLLGWQGLLLVAVFIALLGATLIIYHKKINGITGDMLGAMTEIIEATLFLVASAGGIS